MHLARRELLDDFLGFVGESADEEARNIAERLLNRVLTSIWLKHEFRVYRSPVPMEVTLTVNQARYALPDYFGRVGPGKARNLTRGGTPLEPLSAGDLERFYPRAGTSLEVAGTPGAYEILGAVGVHTQPVAAGEALEAVSDNAADVDIVVALTGEDANGNWTRTQVTLTGTVAVALGTWGYVDECAKAYQAAVTPATELTSSRGMVTIRKVTDATELQKLFPQETSREHQVLTLYPKPAAADVLAIPVIRRPKRLFHDADPIPDLWAPAIFEGMQIEWAVNRGELPVTTAAMVPRPALIDLVAFENETGGRPRRMPFGVGG